jgi:hypothetical protein
LLAPFDEKVRGAGHPFACGELVCWRGADADVPAGSVGEVLCVHGDGDVEVLFFAATASEAVFTFKADRLERAVGDYSRSGGGGASSSSSSSSSSRSGTAAASAKSGRAAAAAAAASAKLAARHAAAVAHGALVGWALLPLFGPDHALKLPGRSRVGCVLGDGLRDPAGSGQQQQRAAAVPRYRYSKDGPRTERKPTASASPAAATAAAVAAPNGAAAESVAGSEGGSAGAAAAAAAAAKRGGPGSPLLPLAYSHSALVGSSALRRPTAVGDTAVGPDGGAALSTTLVFGVTAGACQV